MRRPPALLPTLQQSLPAIWQGYYVGASVGYGWGISEQTYYRWKRAYGGLESDEVRELKQVVEENARLKKLVAELSLDKVVLQDVLLKKFAGRRS